MYYFYGTPWRFCSRAFLPVSNIWRPSNFFTICVLTTPKFIDSNPGLLLSSIYISDCSLHILFWMFYIWNIWNMDSFPTPTQNCSSSVHLPPRCSSQKPRSHLRPSLQQWSWNQSLDPTEYTSKYLSSLSSFEPHWRCPNSSQNHLLSLQYLPNWLPCVHVCSTPNLYSIWQPNIFQEPNLMSFPFLNFSIASCRIWSLFAPLTLHVLFLQKWGSPTPGNTE